MASISFTTKRASDKSSDDAGKHLRINGEGGPSFSLSAKLGAIQRALSKTQANNRQHLRVALWAVGDLLLGSLLHRLFLSESRSAHRASNVKRSDLQIDLVIRLLLHARLLMLGARSSLGNNGPIFLVTRDYFRTTTHETNCDVAGNEQLTS